MKSDTPKVAHTLLDKPLVRWVIDCAKDAGATQICVVLGHQREKVMALVDDVPIVFQEKRLGTADAAKQARPVLAGKDAPESVIVLNGDTPLIKPETLRDLALAREASGAHACVLTFKAQNPTGYGRIVRDLEGSFVKIVEEEDASIAERNIHEVNSGVYCFDTKVLFAALERVGNDNAQGEYYLTDTLPVIMEAGGRVDIFSTEDESELVGVNNRVMLAEAAAILRQRINTRHMLEGVTMLDPSSVWIGPDVELEHDVEVLPMTLLMGDTHVGRGTVLGPNTRINSCQIGEDCSIDETIAIGSTIGNRVSTGPRAYLRPGTVLKDGVHIGTSVELKNSTIGVNSKVPHLSYIGDSQVGREVNIGAGSITCNYDGVNKHPTEIGDHAFVGSSTMFVAPVKVGNDTVTGAGSVITQDVPNGALALERSEQITKEGWSAEHKKKLIGRTGSFQTVV
jgi:bifunctional UDP-N-acetylglucosamine pyrophosphorylase/glucosamine-1-phosphate N-acetyltransferase